MTEKELRKLKRMDLLEIMTEQALKIEEQEKQIEALQLQLDDRMIMLEQSGSVAEAALALNNVFASAQSAANEYLDSIRAKKEQSEQELEKARREAQDIIAAASKKAEEIEANAHEHMMQMVSEAAEQQIRERETEPQKDDSSSRSRFWRRNG